MKEIRIGLLHPPLNEFQYEIACVRKRFTVVVCHRRFGKTEFAAALLVDEAMKNTRTYPVPQYAFVSPQQNQAKRNAWPKFVQAVKKLMPLGAKLKEQDNQIILPNGAVIHFVGTDKNANALLGLYLDGVVLDEFGHIKWEVWLTTIRPTLADYHGWAVFMGTPQGPNHFKTVCKQGQSKDPKFSDWATLIFPEEATRGKLSWFSDEEREAMANEYGGKDSSRWRREMKCEFDVSPEEAFISLPLATAAARPHPDPEQVKGVPVILGVDVGRNDGDPSVICERRGSLVAPIESYPGLNNMAFADVVARRIRESNARYCFIDMGGGQGVVDRLHQMGADFRQKVVGIHFQASQGADPRYLNKRAEMHGTVKEELKAGRLWLPPGCQTLLEDITAPTSWETGNGKIQLESKDDIKARLQRSPNEGDALILTYAWPHAAMGVVQKRGDLSAKEREEYDPYKNLQ